MKSSIQAERYLSKDNPEEDLSQLLNLDLSTPRLHEISPGMDVPIEIFQKHFFLTDISSMYVLPDKKIISQNPHGLTGGLFQFTLDSMDIKSIYRTDRPDQIHNLI